MFLTLHTCFLSPTLCLKLGFKIWVASCEKEGFIVEQPGTAQHQHTFHYFFLHYLLVTTNGKNFIAIFYIHILCKSLCRLLESQELSFVFIKLQNYHKSCWCLSFMQAHFYGPITHQRRVWRTWGHNKSASASGSVTGLSVRQLVCVWSYLVLHSSANTCLISVPKQIASFNANVTQIHFVLKCD